jgi:hypothetical protein
MGEASNRRAAILTDRGNANTRQLQLRSISIAGLHCAFVDHYVVTLLVSFVLITYSLSHRVGFLPYANPGSPRIREWRARIGRAIARTLVTGSGLETAASELDASL